MPPEIGAAGASFDRPHRAEERRQAPCHRRGRRKRGCASPAGRRARRIPLLPSGPWLRAASGPLRQLARKGVGHLTSSSLEHPRAAKDREAPARQFSLLRLWKGKVTWLEVIERMVRPERFELPTFWFVARRSIQLS